MSPIRPTGGASQFPARAASRFMRRFNGGCRSEPLEGRVLLATFTVTTTADAGPGSLRQAILDANTAAGPDSIQFAIPAVAGDVHSIRPQSPLPVVRGPTTIDGTTQPGYASTPVIELDGSLAGPSADGLTLTFGPGLVRGLAVNRFGRHGVSIGAANVRLEACHVGVTPAGDRAAGNVGAGVRVSGVPTGVVVGGTSAAQRNVISANGLAGVLVTAAGTTNIQGNYIGTDATGAAALGNRAEGVLVTGENVIVNVGDARPGGGNVISGNGGSGVRVSELASAVIQGNRIGTDAAGARAVPNGISVLQPYQDGVTAIGATRVEVGRPNVAARNLISGNVGSGVMIAGGLGDMLVVGNYIGTDAAGRAPLGNGGEGIAFTHALVGGRRTVQDNLMSANARNGMLVLNAGVTISGNSIGTDAEGGVALGNGGNGIELINGSATIGFGNPPSGGRNIISGNDGHGIRAVASGATVTGNYIGTNAAGMAAIPNGGDGVRVEGATTRDVTIGVRSLSTPLGNVISGNRANGLTVLTSSARVTARANRIGTRADDAALGNGGDGIAVRDSSGVVIGGTLSGEGNTIASNAGSGVSVAGRDASRPAPSSAGVLGNSIHSNGRLGIDLLSPDDPATGVTPNDAGDPDQGPNDLLNHPVIQSALVNTLATVVTVTLDAPRSRMYRVDVFSSTEPDPSGSGEGRTYLGGGNVTLGATPGTATIQVERALAGSHITATATTFSGFPSQMTSEFSPPVVATPAPPPRVVGRHVFYNDSVFDGDDPAANVQDDRAIATDKRALLPGEVGSFANVTSYDGGINGVMIDIENLPFAGEATRADFQLRAGTSSDTSEWTTAPTPYDFEFRRGAGVGGSDRVSMVWSFNGMRNKWLQVTVLPTQRTGLQRPDVFYFGNLVGECAGPPGPVMYVSPADWAATRSALNSTVGVTHRYDHNRDGRVSPADLAIVRSNFQRSLVAPPTAPAPAAPRTSVAEELLGESPV